MARKPPRFPPDRDPHLLFVSDGAGHEWTILSLAEYLKGQPGCSRDHLRARCAAEMWVEERRQFRLKKAAAAKQYARGHVPPGTTQKMAVATGVPGFATHVLNKVAEQVAEQIAPDIAELDKRAIAMREQILSCAELILNDAQTVLVTKRVKLVVEDGEPTADLGEIPAGDFVRKTEFRDRRAVASMVQTAAGIYHMVVEVDPSQRFRLQRAQVEALQKQVELMTAKLKGQLPPDEVRIVDPSSAEYRETVQRVFGIESGRRMSVLDLWKKDNADGGSGDADDGTNN